MEEYEVRLNELKAKILDAELAWTKAKKSMEEAISMQKELLSSTEKIDEVVNEIDNVAPPVEAVVETPVEEAPQVEAAPVEAVVETPVEEAPQEEAAPVEAVVETPVEEAPQVEAAPVEESASVTEVTVPAENDLAETPVQIIPPIEESKEETTPAAEPVSDVVDSSKDEVVLPAIEPTVPGVSEPESKTEEQPVALTPTVDETTDTKKETYKKDYANVDKKILVNITQAEKLRASRETQKGLFNSANTIGKSKDLEAMVNDMQELYDKGETEKAESLSNEIQKQLQMQKQGA